MSRVADRDASSGADEAERERRLGRKGQMYCDRCDGCGWYDGGRTLQTKCERCGGTGVVRVPSERVGGE